MVPQTLRKGPLLLFITAVLIFLATFSVRRYALLPYGLQIEEFDRQQSTSSGDSPLPRKIWQIFSTPAHTTNAPLNSIDAKALGDTTSWIGLNPGYQYQLLGGDSADAFVIKHFSHNELIIDTYFSLRNPGLKTDLLRAYHLAFLYREISYLSTLYSQQKSPEDGQECYLVLWIEGGVYSDLDTWAIRPIDDWIPEHLRVEGGIRAVVGLEWDQLDGEPWPGFGNEPSYMTHVVQFCQWTLAAVPGHPLFENAYQTSIERIRQLAVTQHTSISDMDPTGYEVVTTTGPSAWTDVVLEELQRADPMITLKDLSNMKGSRVIGDILVLTIDGFGMGQPHSHSTSDGTTPDTALVKHAFRHSWLPNIPKP